MLKAGCDLFFIFNLSTNFTLLIPRLSMKGQRQVFSSRRAVKDCPRLVLFPLVSFQCGTFPWYPISFETVGTTRRYLIRHRKQLRPVSFFVNIPLTTPRINFRISECHHRFSIDLIIIFSAKNGNSKKNVLGPY